MTFQETLDYLYTTLPIFQRVGASAYKENLDNTLALCAELDNPHLKFKSVHVAGTNGKGSSSHMIAAVLQKSGYKTGLFTSPHLKEFTERIKINGQEVNKEFVIDFVERMRPAMERIQPSFFEVTVAMAFDFFSRNQIDIAVIEVGLGGRLDSTNVILPLVSLITNIGYDHMDLLGDTLPKIAGEKAGIIKERVPVVVSQRQEEVESVFIDKAAALHAPITFASDSLQAKPTGSPGVYQIYSGPTLRMEELECGLKGLYQEKNIPGVLMTLDKLKKPGLTISDESVQAGLSNVISLTGLKGRWQKLNDRPLIICDTGHNVDGISEVVRQIKSLTYNKLHIVLGTVNDKDISGVLQLLPKDANYYFCQANIPRALPAAELAAKASKFGLHGRVVEDVNDAIKTATAESQPNDFIFVGGSTFVVAEIENL